MKGKVAENMNFVLHLVIYIVTCMECWTVEALSHSVNPNLEYELINVNKLATTVPTTILKTDKPIVVIPHQAAPPTKPFVFRKPPPVDLQSKTFAYNPQAKTWTLIKNSDPQPSEETLLWNQSNDKWLTQIAPYY